MRIASFIIMIYCLSACGFKPMLAKNENGYKSLDQVQLIEIKAKNKLKAQRIIMGALDLAANSSPLYQLKLQVLQDSSSIGIMKDSQATRYRIKVTLNYDLLDSNSQKIIDSGSLYSYNSYDVADSEFINYVADHYVGDNILIELCEELKNRLILVLPVRK